jgi:hypothetical protein
MLAAMIENSNQLSVVSCQLSAISTPYYVLRTPYLVIFLLLFAGTQSLAADASQQVWIVSTRCAPQCGELGTVPECLRYWRMDDDCQWSRSDAEAFAAADDVAMPTVVFIHGNRANAEEAVNKAWYAYESIRAEAAGRPFRYVIWSWPADRVCLRGRNDARLKADYSSANAYYLALWLDKLRPGVKVSLIGHSFGPRIIAGALHLLAGGEVAGQNLPAATVAAWKEGKRNPLRVMLLAAALDEDCLAPNGCHGLALSLIDRVLITCNGCDPVLLRYPRLNGRGGPEALGFVGPSGIADAGNAAVVDVSGSVGRRHDWRLYCSAAEVCSRWQQYTFLEP